MSDQQRALFGTEPDPDVPLAIRGRCGVCNAQRVRADERWFTVEAWDDAIVNGVTVTVCSRICLVTWAERGAMP